MDCQEARPLLGELRDGALPRDSASAVSSHASRCASCKKELASLESLGRLLKDLPRRPLPAGFMARLERRRREPAKASSPAWAPRTLAFSLGSLAVAVAVYRGASPSPETAAPAPAAVPFAAHDRGAAAGAASAPGLSAPPPSFRPGRDAGAPMGLKAKRLTNEDLHSRLLDESERMGIQAIAPQEEELRTRPFLGATKLGGASTRREAEASIRQLAALRRAVDASRGGPPLVPIEGRTAPVLGADALDSGKPFDAAAAAPHGRTWSGAYSGELEGGRTASDEASWRALWAAWSAEPAPAVDFKTSQVVAVFLGPRPSGGHGVEIVRVERTASHLLVSWRETEPPPGASAGGPASPFAARVVPRSDLPVRFRRLR